MYDGVPSTEPARDSIASDPLRSVRTAESSSLGADRPLLVGHAPLVEHLGQAPVHDLDLAEAADHDVRRLQVAVDHAPRVGVGHRLADLLEDREESHPVLVRAPARRQQRRQGAAPDQLHRDEQPAVGEPAQLVDRDDPRVLELAADLRLLDEPADHLGVVAVLLPDHLDGQVAAEVEVAALEDRAHPAPGELADELVARRLAREVGHLGRARAGSAARRRRSPGDGRAGPPRSHRPGPAGREAADGPVPRPTVRRIRSRSRGRDLRRIGREGGPEAEQAAGAEPRRRFAGRRAAQSGQVSAPIIPDPPPVPRPRSDTACPDLFDWDQRRRTLQDRAGLQPSRAAKRARISSSTWAASPTVAAISSRSSRP